MLLRRLNIRSPYRPSYFFNPPIKRNILTLAIETSCDDTSVAIVEKNGTRATLHFNEKITADNGHMRGIHPIVALESHEENLASLIQRAITTLPKHPDFISVTRGPGMRSNLSTGIATAKGLAVAWNIPLIGVHHMQAHALTARLASAMENASAVVYPDFPFLSLLVSGGHTLLTRSQSLTSHEILASTTDIALGECLDKTARIILPEAIIESVSHTSYGALLENYAFASSDFGYAPPPTRAVEIQNSPTKFGWSMPMPFANTRSMQFSFAGIDSYTRRVVKNGWDPINRRLALDTRPVPIAKDESIYLAREIMRAAFEHLTSRVIMALDAEHCRSNSLVLSGGVAANSYLRHILSSFLAVRGYSHVKVTAPPAYLCTDNAAMIGWTGCEMYEAGHCDSLAIRALAKWSMDNLLFPDRDVSNSRWIVRNTPLVQNQSA